MGLANEFPSTEAKFENEACTYQEKEAKHSSVEIPSKISSMDSTNDEIQQAEEKNYQDRVSKRTRATLFIVAIIVLIIGRNGVPDIESANVQDKVIEALQVVNDFINKSGNEIYRDVMQMFCSFFVDVVFITTFGYWVLRGKGIRLPISMLVFYIVRALVQQVWISPFPQGYYWEAPLLPSLVVPYGRGSDFFFSGHSGFLVICASEWHKIKMPKMRNFSICVAIYTIFILLTYRIHYSIDIFTGVIFAEWCFGKVDLHEEKIINFFASFKNIGKLFGAKNNKMVDEVLPM